MRKDFGAKPFLYPQPVLMIATYGEDGTPDVMNAAWGGIADMKRVAMYLSASHKTVKNILARKAFTVSMADADHVTECDYLGIVSANQVPDKVARAGFHVTKSAHVDAPLVDELPLALECARRVWGAIYLNTLYLELQVGAEDPGEAAMAYGRANAALGAIWTPLVRAFHVKDGHARVNLDFDRKEPALYARAELSIRLGQALWLGLYFGLKALRALLRVKNEKKQQQRKAA